jgi:hypothetical protein
MFRTLRPATLAWWALLALSAASVMTAGLGRQAQGHLWMALVVATLCAIKADLLIRHYLEASQAGPLFHGVVRLFAWLAPLLMGMSAVHEAWFG